MLTSSGGRFGPSQPVTKGIPLEPACLAACFPLYSFVREPKSEKLWPDFHWVTSLVNSVTDIHLWASSYHSFCYAFSGRRENFRSTFGNRSMKLRFHNLAAHHGSSLLEMGILFRSSSCVIVRWIYLQTRSKLVRSISQSNNLISETWQYCTIQST